MAWITDGSIGFSINENVVTHIDDGRFDNVFNCLWEEGEGVSVGKHYWKIHFETLEGDGGVGLTSKENFKRGYECKALCYNGNLSNGSCLLLSDFGPSPTAGDTVGILASFGRNKLKVYFDLNGYSMGLAFKVPGVNFASIFPMVRFKQSGSATCHKTIEIPNITKRHRSMLCGIEGDWKLQSLTEKRTGFSISSSTTALEIQPTMNLQQTGTDQYSWVIDVVNTMSSTLTKKDGKWRICVIFSSLVGGPTSVMELEDKISNLMAGVEKVDLNEDGCLHIKSDTMSTVWKRYQSHAPRVYAKNSRCVLT